MVINMKNSRAIFWKQIKDTLKNKVVLIQFVMFPLMVVLMENMVAIEGMPEHFFVRMFATMYVGMAPLTSMSAILAEEKENATLKVLLMSNVRPFEYLLGAGSYVWMACMAGACVFGVVGEYRGKDFFLFLVIMAMGILASLLVGAAIGTWSRNQMMATSLSVPLMLVFSFLPMFSLFNDKIQKIAKFTYSEQVGIMIDQLGQNMAFFENMTIISGNLIIAFLCFVFAYRKCGLA